MSVDRFAQVRVLKLVGALDTNSQIYTAVLHDQVRTAAQFAAWLAQPGLPVA